MLDVSKPRHSGFQLPMFLISVCRHTCESRDGSHLQVVICGKDSNIPLIHAQKILPKTKLHHILKYTVDLILTLQRYTISVGELRVNFEKKILHLEGLR